MGGKYEIRGWNDDEVGLSFYDFTDSWFKMKILVWRAKRKCRSVLLIVKKKVKGF